jgi:hypothetical protein
METTRGRSSASRQMIECKMHGMTPWVKTVRLKRANLFRSTSNCRHWWAWLAGLFSADFVAKVAERAL